MRFFPLVQCIPRNTKQPGITLKNSQWQVKCLKKTNRNLKFNLSFVVSPSVPEYLFSATEFWYMQTLLYLIIYIKRGFTLEQRLFLASPQLLKHHLIHRLLALAKKFCLSLCWSMSSSILKIMLKLIMFASLQLDLMYAKGKFKQLRLV